MTDHNWSALVYGDYEIVLPVYVKTKFFVPYVTQAFLCQKSSFLSVGEFISTVDVKHFEQYIQRHFIKANISFPQPLIQNKTFTKKVNHVLNLERPYSEIHQDYNRNTKRNIAFAKSKEIKIIEEIEDAEFIKFMVLNDKTNLIEKHQNKTLQLINYTKQEKKSLTLAGYDKNGLNSVAFFIIENDVLYFLLCASNEFGIENNSMFLLVNLAIQKFAGKVKSLDFTGSSIKNIARRNEGFGAESQEYVHYSFTKW
jgi:hypothetical protein